MKTVLRKSFKRELFLCFIVVALVPLVITGCFLVSVLKARLSRDYEEKTQEQLISVENRMTGVFDETERVAEEIMSDAVIVDGIIQTDSWLKNKAYKRLYEKTQDLREIAWFHVYDAQGVCSLSTSPQGAAGELPVYWGIIKGGKDTFSGNDFAPGVLGTVFEYALPAGSPCDSGRERRMRRFRCSGYDGRSF